MIKKRFAFILHLLTFFLACPPPQPGTVWVDVCSVSGLLPTEFCPAVEERQFKIGQQPIIPCQAHYATTLICDETGRIAVPGCPSTHAVPEAEAAELGGCRCHARYHRAPALMVLAWLDGQSRVHRMSDGQLEYFARKVGEAGVDLVRIFYPGWVDNYAEVLPYLRTGEGPELIDRRFDLDKFNPAYDTNLSRLARVLSRHEVGLYVDMADQCGVGTDWDCWRRNVNGVRGWWDESDLALEYWKAAVDRVLNLIGGPQGNLVGFGNELRHPADDDIDADYILKWGGRRLDYLLSKGCARPVPFSGGGRFAHKMLGYLSAEDGYYPGYDFVSLVVHGIGILENIPPGESSVEDWLRTEFSVERFYGYSDDGADTNWWNKIPPDKRGTCDVHGNICGASVDEKIRTLKVFHAVFGNRLQIIEFLPREIADVMGDAIAEESLEAFWRVALALYGVEIRR